MVLNFYKHKRIWKFVFLISAVTIGAFTLLYTNKLTDELKESERKRAELWAEATRQLTTTKTIESSISLVFEIIRANTTIPVILVDSNDQVLFYRNIKLPANDSVSFLRHELEEMKAYSPPFVVDLGNGEMQYMYFKESLLITKLSWFPIVQMLVVTLFIFIAYLAFSSSRKAEQDQVWVGLSKETAHQLGTPTSSLLGWVDVLRLNDENASIADELEKDVYRLQVVTDRFSKIGAKPELELQDIQPILRDIIDYLDRRTSANVSFVYNEAKDRVVLAKVNKVLFQWVVENISKNAVDAIEGVGQIRFEISKEHNRLILDIIDTGKGMPRKMYKTVFRPGFTTKQRGWGLGLSLAKRIIEGYHGGKLFVKESEINKGTTFRISLPV